MRIGCAEQHAIGHDACTTSTQFEHTDEQRDEEKLGLLGPCQSKKRRVDHLIIEAARERRIGQTQRIVVLQSVLIRQAVLGENRRVIDAIQHQVHRADAQHLGVGIEATEHPMSEMILILGFQHLVDVFILDAFGTFDQEAGSSHRGIADAVVDLRFHQRHHHVDDVTRCAELSIGTRCCHLAKYVFIDIAHRVSIVHVEFLNALHHFDQRARLLDEEDGIVHEAAIGRSLLVADVLDEREDIEAHCVEHLFGREVLEHVPPQRIIRHILPRVGIMPVATLEDDLRIIERRYSKCLCRCLLVELRIVQHLHKEEISHLLQYIDGVGDASRPEAHPDGINL